MRPHFFLTTLYCTCTSHIFVYKPVGKQGLSWIELMAQNLWHRTIHTKNIDISAYRLNRSRSNMCVNIWLNQCSPCTSVWPQQAVWSSCWSSMFNGIRPVPTNKRFNSAYLQIKYLICRKIHSNTVRLDKTFYWWSQVTMMF